MISSLMERPSAIGLGCVTFGREIDEAASFAMMDFAAEQGVALFDTASAYAQGASEKIVGRWAAQRGAGEARPEIATKILPPYTAETMERALAESRARLDVAAVDVLFLHRWDASLQTEEPYRVMEEWIQRGLVRTLGVSNITEPQLAESLAWQARVGAARFRWVQNIHNYAVRGFPNAMRALCAQAGIQLMGYSPLGAGFLTGKHRAGVAEGSRFAIIPGHQAIYFTDEARSRLARLEQVATESARSQVELALAWAIQQPGMAMVLVGGRTATQIEQILRAQKRAGDAGEVEVMRRLET
jgi:aryl-alcohol dehydrogenase-like predicted oxidoreductase